MKKIGSKPKRKLTAFGGKRTGGVKGASFVAGTLIATENGMQPIEKVKDGDLVWSENPATGEKGLKKVVRTFVNETYELVHVSIDGQSIVTTPEHPFYVPEKGWMKSVDLRKGDILVTVNGEYQVVKKVQHELLEIPIKVYNFEVEDFHTYYVGKNSVLVHNTCLKKFYTSIKESPAYNKTFSPVKNGLKKVNMNNASLSSELRANGSGWKKVYSDGFLNGEKVSYHYFQDKSGKVFNVKMKYGWSNK